MTARDFILIARTLRDSHIAGTARDALARDFADALASTNPRFNRAMFLRACGVNA